MIKCCKVVVTWFGPRRRFIFDMDDGIDLLKYTVETEKNVDPGPGIELDLVIVNNSSVYEKHKKGNDYLQSINGLKTKTGKIIVIPGDNIGMGFGGYNAAYSNLSSNYDYWFFTEDDFIFWKDGYYRSMVDQIESDSSIGFVASIGTAGGDSHAHGSIGLTKQEYLERARQAEFYFKLGGVEYFKPAGVLPHLQEELDNEDFTNIRMQCIAGEIAFSSIYRKLGFRLVRTNFNSCPYLRWFNDDSAECDIKCWGKPASVVTVEQKIALGLRPIASYAFSPHGP